jgi:hypothetical protein
MPPSPWPGARAARTGDRVRRDHEEFSLTWSDDYRCGWRLRSDMYVPTLSTEGGEVLAESQWPMPSRPILAAAARGRPVSGPPGTGFGRRRWSVQRSPPLELLHLFSVPRSPPPAAAAGPGAARQARALARDGFAGGARDRRRWSCCVDRRHRRHESRASCHIQFKLTVPVTWDNW